jgi:hypothetical protein
MLDHKTHEERSHGRPESRHQSPPAHLLSSFVLEEEFRYNAAPDPKRWAYEDCRQDSRRHLRSIGRTEYTADIAEATSQRRDDECGAAPEVLGYRIPYQWEKPQCQNLRPVSQVLVYRSFYFIIAELNSLVQTSNKRLVQLTFRTSRRSHEIPE